jgi:hypothetical protein
MIMMESTLSFARTRAERDQSDDPRPCIGERYATGRRTSTPCARLRGRS